MQHLAPVFLQQVRLCSRPCHILIKRKWWQGLYTFPYILFSTPGGKQDPSCSGYLSIECGCVQGLARLSNLELLDEEDLLELGVRQQVDRRALLTAIHNFSQRTKHYTRHALRDGQRKRPMPQLEPRCVQTRHVGLLPPEPVEPLAGGECSRPY